MANLSKAARDYLATLCFKKPDSGIKTASLIWMHALAVGYSPLYLKENADGVRQDWPRVPLPDSRELLEASAKLGYKISGLLDHQNQIKGLNCGAYRADVKVLARISSVSGKNLDPEAGEINLTAGWGHLGKDGVTMPGKGRAVEREYREEELAAIKEGEKVLGLKAGQALECLGGTTYDVYLNDVAYWRNVPSRVWGYMIGGYQVLKKWLSYREFDILGRSLTDAEVREVAETARRLAAILLLTPELDENYRQCRDSAYAWPEESV